MVLKLLAGIPLSVEINERTIHESVRFAHRLLYVSVVMEISHITI